MPLTTVTDIPIDMKISAIDIGSNSVRLAMFADGKTLYKRKQTTRLGEGVALDGNLSFAAIERTAQAVSSFFREAAQEGADRVYAFATAAVRSAANGTDFVKRVKELCGLEVDVVSGQTEAELGILGALRGKDGGIIDVGGASTEVSIACGGKISFAASVNIGTVRLSDLAGRNREKLTAVIAERLKDFGEYDASGERIYSIGGTASRLASVKYGLLEYRPDITDGTVLTRDELYVYADKFLTMPVEEIRATTICKNSADIVGGGCLLMGKVMEHFRIERIIVSESDNLEGYVLRKEGRL